jgi:hypothetical protein
MVTGPSHPTAAEDAASLAVARRHRAALLHSIQTFERALAAPAGDPGWWARVSTRLHALRELRTWASDLLRELSRHRQRGADLVYEAYETDIGGET